MEENELWNEAQQKKREQQEREAEALAAMVAVWLAYLAQLEILFQQVAEAAQRAADSGIALTPQALAEIEATRLAVAQSLLLADAAVDQWIPMIEAEQRRATEDAQGDANDLIGIAGAGILLGILASLPGISLPPDVIAAINGGLLTGEALRATLVSRLGEFLTRAVNDMAEAAAGGSGAAGALQAAIDQLMRFGDTAAIIGSDQAAKAYRDALLAAYTEASGKIPIIGYRRVSKRDASVCPACIALDGRIYGLRETFSEHPRGRCIAVPVFEGQQGQAWQQGTAWLAAQPADVQRRILGPGRYDRFVKGEISLDDLAKTLPDGGLQSKPTKDL